MATPSASSRLTNRNQTTLPPAVRKALKLGKGERVGYVIEGNEVRLVNATALEEHHDPIVSGFLALLAADMKLHPEGLQVFPSDLLARAAALTKDVDIDHEAPIDGVTAL